MLRAAGHWLRCQSQRTCYLWSFHGLSKGKSLNWVLDKQPSAQKEGCPCNCPYRHMMFLEKHGPTSWLAREAACIARCQSDQEYKEPGKTVRFPVVARDYWEPPGPLYLSTMWEPLQRQKSSAGSNNFQCPFVDQPPASCPHLMRPWQVVLFKCRKCLHFHGRSY